MARHYGAGGAQSSSYGVAESADPVVSWNFSMLWVGFDGITQRWATGPTPRTGRRGLSRVVLIRKNMMPGKGQPAAVHSHILPGTHYTGEMTAIPAMVDVPHRVEETFLTSGVIRDHLGLGDSRVGSELTGMRWSEYSARC